MNDHIEIKHIAAIVLKFFWLVIVFAIIGLWGGLVISRKQTPVYESTTTILVGEILESNDLNRTDILTSELVATTYAEMVRRQPVLEGVVQALDLNQSWRDIQEDVRVNLVEGTQLIQISVEASSPSSAQLVANEIAKQLSSFSTAQSQVDGVENSQDFVQQELQRLQTRLESGQERRQSLELELANTSSTERLNEIQSEINLIDGLMTEWETNYTQLLIFMGNRQSPNNLTVIEQAQVTSNPIRPNVRLYMLIGSGVGIFLAIGLIFLLDNLDDRVKSIDDIQRGFDTQSLGIIPKIKGRDYESKLAVIRDHLSSTSEVFRVVGGNLQLYSKNGTRKSIMITSPNHSEGKSLITASLGTALAQAGLTTIIVDANLRQPIMHEIFQIENKNGLMDLLSEGKFMIGEYLQDTQTENLKVLSIGASNLNPSRLLMQQKVQQIISSLTKQSDVILFDCSSILDHADSIFLSTQMDGVILVAASKRTGKKQLRKSIQDLEVAGAEITGILFNKYLPRKLVIVINRFISTRKAKAGIEQTDLEARVTDEQVFNT